MLKFLWFLIVSILSLTLGSFATDVEVFSEIENESVYFNYTFQFGENDGVSSFAFEKPEGSRFIDAYFSNGSKINPLVAGDFFIFEPENSVRGETISVLFESPNTYSTLKDSGTFSTYVTFNIEVDSLEFTYDSGEYSNKEFYEVFPRDHILLENNTVRWSLRNISSEQLFLLSYEQEDSVSSSQNEGILLILLSLPILFFVVLFILLKLSSKNLKEKKNRNGDSHNSAVKSSSEMEKLENNQYEENNSPEDSHLENSSVETQELDNNERETNEEGTTKREWTTNELFEDFITKYLTQNEQEVVRIIYQHQGIAQNDILNYTPSLTKSNLSKIIAKLNNKKLLNRVKVGKINKIYLGERLDFEKHPSS